MKARALAIIDALAKAGLWTWNQRSRIAGVLVYGAAPGYAWWMLRHRDALPSMAANRLDEGATSGVLTASLISVAIALVAIGALHLRTARQSSDAKGDAQDTKRELELVETLDRCLRHGVLTLTLPAIAALATPAIESSHPWFTFALAAFATGVLVIWSYELPARERPDNKLLHIQIPALLSALVVGIYVYEISRLALVHHHNLSTSIIVLQTAWIAAGALPLYLLVVRKLDSHWAGFCLVLSYLLHPGIQGANLYGFHSLSLAIPLLFAAVLLLEIGALKSYAATIALLLLVREDMSLLSASLGLYALITGRGRVGVLTILASIAYLGVAKLLLMPDAGLLMKSSDHTYGYSNHFGYLIPEGRGGVRAMLSSLISNPVFVLRSMLSEAKLLYIARCFGPLLMLPFFARPGRVLLVYGLAFCLLGTKLALFSLHFPHVTLHTPFAFALVPLVLADPAQSPALSRFAATQVRFARAGVLGCAMMSLLVSWKYGALIEKVTPDVALDAVLETRL